MTAEVITYMAADQNRERRMQFALVAQCAPFLKGLRAASILSVEEKSVPDLCRILEATDISCRVLPAEKGRCLVLFYRKGRISMLLSQEAVRRFLEDYGYEDGDTEPERAVTRLCRRMEQYKEEIGTFPHELGVFLGYPLEDVQAFIRNGGRGSLLAGYWKVYHNPERARLTFLAYDKARDSAVNEFLSGKNIREIAAAENEL